MHGDVANDTSLRVTYTAAAPSSREAEVLKTGNPNVTFEFLQIFLVSEQNNLSCLKLCLTIQLKSAPCQCWTAAMPRKLEHLLRTQQIISEGNSCLVCARAGPFMGRPVLASPQFNRPVEPLCCTSNSSSMVGPGKVWLLTTQLRHGIRITSSLRWYLPA